MFGFSWFKIAAIALAALTIAGVIFASYKYVTDLQTLNRELAADKATLTANVATLEEAILGQKKAIESMEKDNVLKDQILQETLDEFSDSRSRVRDLEDRLGQHELGFLAASKPNLVESIINNATGDVGRCFEIASGSPLTIDELKASKPSEINRECPELANPNYQEEK